MTSKEYSKRYYQLNKDKCKAQMKAWREVNKDKFTEYHREYMKEYIKSDMNSLGQTKKSIRSKSRNILRQMNLNIPDYEIHHCFGYEDHRNFIYIPKELHLQIHQYLRDNGIDADTDHYNQIAQLIINYIKCNEKHILILKQSQ